MSGPLAPAAFLALAATCAPGADPARLSDYSLVESARDPLAINVNGAGGGAQHAATMEAAVALATRLVAAGRSVDLGLMQLNSAHLGEPGMPRTVAEAMEPCRNVAAGAAVLAAADHQAACIYNTGKPGCTNGYPEKVAASAAQRLRGRISASTPAPAATPMPARAPQADPDAPPSWAVFAERRPRPTEPQGDREAAPAVTVTASQTENIPR